MSRNRFLLCALVVAAAGWLGACSQGGSTQPPANQAAPNQAAPNQAAPSQGSAPSGAAQPQGAQAPAAQPAAPQPGSPANAPASEPNAPPPVERGEQAARPPTSSPAPPAASPSSARPASAEKPRPAGTSSATDRAPSAPEKAAAAKPQHREVTLPAGTALSVTLRTPVASDASKVEDEVHGRLANAIVADGVTVVPADTAIVGTVRDTKRSGRVKGLASVSFQFERLVVRGESLEIRTAPVSRQAAAKRSQDVKKGAIGAAAGAIIGAVAGGGKGAAIGAGVGGTGAVMATRGEEVRLPAGTTVRTTLRQPLTVIVPR